MSILYRFCLQGGVGLPNLWWYYRGAQVAQISVIYSRGVKPDWVFMERQAVPNYTLDYLLWCPPKSRPPILSPTLSHSIALCDVLHKSPKICSELHPLTHIFHNPLYPPGMDIRAFQRWLHKGLFRIGHLLQFQWPFNLELLQQ